MKQSEMRARYNLQHLVHSLIFHLVQSLSTDLKEIKLQQKMYDEELIKLATGNEQFRKRTSDFKSRYVENTSL